MKRLAQQTRLQRTLRRPQLSDTLDEKLLNELLSEALPEVDQDLLGTSSKRLDQIEESRRRLDTLKKNERAVREFAVTYAAYARAELRERRDRLRAAAGELAEAAQRYDTTAAQRDTLQAELDQANAAVEAAQATLTKLREEERTLLSSPEMKAAGELIRAREASVRAQQALARQQERLDEAKEAQARYQQRLGSYEQQLGVANHRFEEELARLDELAASAGIGSHAQLAATLAAPDTTAGPVIEQLERAVADRRDDIAEVRQRRQLAENQAKIAARERNACAEAREQAVEATDARVAAEDALTAARGTLAARIADWAESLSEIDLDTELLTRLEEACDDAGAPEAPRLAELAAPAFAARELLHARAELELDQRAAQLAQERAPLEAEKAELENEVDPEPQLLPTRSAREPDRPGAPFWRLLDFAGSVAEADRAGLEGALEGAGILDAWVCPDGTVLAAGSDDVALVPAPIGSGATLADCLVPADGELPVTRELVSELLRSIGLGRSGDQGFVVGADGSYGFGPARGAHPKEHAQFIGATARAANRARRLAELAASLAALDEQDAALAADRTELDGRRRQAELEQRRLPGEREARDAYVSHQGACLDEQATQREFSRLETTAIAAEREADQRAGDVEIVARQRGLDPSGSEASLQAAAAQLDRYADALRGLRDADSDRRSALQRVDDLGGVLADARRRSDDQAAEVEHAQTAAQTAEGQLRAIEAVGESAERALERAEELKGEIAATEKRAKEGAAHAAGLTGRTAKLANELGHIGDTVTQARAAETSAVEELRLLVRADMLSLALAGRAEAPEREQARGWESGDWLRYFNGIKQEVFATRGGLEHLENTLDNDYQALQQQIDSAHLNVSKERQEGLVLVTGRVEGSIQPLAVLVDTLAEQVEASEKRLSEQDRRLFEEFVTGEVADHLHRRIIEAKQTVERMNAEIAKVQASSGMSIDVSWQRADDASSAQRRALELLQGSPARLTASDQQELQDFIREQVRQARDDAAEKDTTQDQLARALDYRRWHTFKLRKANTARGIAARDLTRHEHDAGSGGEKAIALHLPLLAAAASYPASGKPDALRMVMLDEAFTRIDEEGKRAIMGLITEFDLDIMLTSPDFWGCYEEVPELAIYRLAPRDDNDAAVVTSRFHWDGTRRRAVSDDTPDADVNDPAAGAAETNGHGPAAAEFTLFDETSDAAAEGA